MSWAKYAVKRIVMSIGMLFGASIAIFSIIRLIPGDPATLMLGTEATEATLRALRQRLGLNLPVWRQYLLWMGNVLSGDLGTSVRSGESIRSLVGQRYPRSIQLAFFAILFALIVAVPVGILGALKRNSKADYFALLFSQVGMSVPSFLLGILLIAVFANYLEVLPSSGAVPFVSDPVGNLQRVILPTLALGLINAAVFVRYLRSSFLEEMNKDYVRTARACGHPDRRIRYRYILRNALIPLVTITGMQLGFAIGGVVVIERVFAYPGMGRLVLNSMLNRNYPVTQATLLLFAATFIVINLLVDLVYGLLDPRIRY